MTYEELQAVIRGAFRNLDASAPQARFGIVLDVQKEQYYQIVDMLNDDDDDKKYDKPFLETIINLVDMFRREVYMIDPSKLESRKNDPAIMKLPLENQGLILKALNEEYKDVLENFRRHREEQKRLESLLLDWANADLTDDGKIKPMLYSKLSGGV